MKTEEDLQKTLFVISSGFKPLVQAIEAATFLISCDLGNLLGSASSIIEHKSLEIEALVRGFSVLVLQKRAPRFGLERLR